MAGTSLRLPRLAGLPSARPLDARRLAAAASAVVVSYGVLVLCDWWFDVGWLQVTREGGTGSLPSTAAALALGGLSLWASIRASAEPPDARGGWASGRRVSRALAALVVVIGASALASYLLDLDLGLDPPSDPLAGVSLLPTPNTAVAIALLGLALLARDLPAVRGIRPVEALAAIPILLALVALFGHVYGAALLHGAIRSLHTVGMTTTTSIALLLLAAGAVAAETTEGLMGRLASPHAGGRMARRLLAFVVALPLLGLAAALGQRMGLYTQPEGAALLATTTTCFAAAWILATAGSLDRTDAARARALADAAKWRLFFERAEWGAAIGSPDGTLELVNAAFARQHGLGVDEMTGMSLASLFAPDRQGDLARLCDAASAQGHARIESEHVRRDGTRFPVRIDAAAIRDETGHVQRFAIDARDVTLEKQAEAQRARLAALVESSDDAIVALALDGTVLDWNPAAERLYGFRAAEIVGRSLRAAVPEERFVETQSALARLARGERVPSFETVRRRKDGSLVDVSLTASPIVDARGRVVGASAIARDIGQRKRMEEALRASEQRFRDFFEHASEGIFLADPEGRYVDVNEAGCALLGCRREELLGHTIAELIPPEDVPRLEDSRRQMMRGGVHTAEWRLRHHDGSWIHVEVSAQILASGQWQAFVRDIRERKALEAERRRAEDTERRLRDELERVMLAGSAITDELAGIPETSLASILHAIALQARMLTGADLAAVAMGHDPDRPFEQWAAVGVDREAVERVVGRLPRPRGVLGRVAIMGQTIRIDDVTRHPGYVGVPAGHPEVRAMLAVPIRHRGTSVGSVFLGRRSAAAPFTDADQRVVEMLASRVGGAIAAARAYAGEALQRAWLQAVLDQMPEGVIILGPGGRIELENRAAQRFARRTDRVDPWGNPVVFDVRDRRGAMVAIEDVPLARALSRGETITSAELAILDREGKVVPVLASATPVRIGEGTVGAVVVFQDITVLKELEQLREEWSSMIAHDLRQPLNVIAIAATTLRRRAEREHHEADVRVLDRIIVATRGIGRMVGDLLDASKIEAHRLTLERSEHDAATLVRDVVERHHDLVPDHPLAWAREEHATVSVDAMRIEQVIVNLLTNARKYGTPGTPIEIAVTAAAGEVEIAIANHGPGIPAEEIGTLFQRFARTRDALRGKIEGTGLGLYICRGIVEAHGGRIRAESVPGGTTTFRIALPRADRADRADA